MAGVERTWCKRGMRKARNPVARQRRMGREREREHERPVDGTTEREKTAREVHERKGRNEPREEREKESDAEQEEARQEEGPGGRAACLCLCFGK